LIELLMSKYHWTLDYILWGISYLNVQMLLADSIQVFHGDSATKGYDMKISGDNPANIEYIMNNLVTD